MFLCVSCRLGCVYLEAFLHVNHSHTYTNTQTPKPTQTMYGVRAHMPLHTHTHTHTHIHVCTCCWIGLSLCNSLRVSLMITCSESNGRALIHIVCLLQPLNTWTGWSDAHTDTHTHTHVHTHLRLDTSWAVMSLPGGTTSILPLFHFKAHGQ